MNKWEILPVWFRILRGYKPFLSVKVTREGHLHYLDYSACDAVQPNNKKALGQISEPRGNRLVEGVLDLIQRNHSQHLSIAGGEPLLRRQEMSVLLPRLNAMGIEVQFITSAALPIPLSWCQLSNLHLVVTMDGLSPEHQSRRSPDEYKNILNNIAGHRVILHCVVLRSMLAHPDFLKEFAAFWSCCSEIEKIWFSLYTPQRDEISEERLTEEERARAIAAIARVNVEYPKVQAPSIILDGYRQPPASPNECMFAQTTLCIAPDLKTIRIPCPMGGNPVCSECGCFASAGLASIGRSKIAGLVKIDDIYRWSHKIGGCFN